MVFTHIGDKSTCQNKCYANINFIKPLFITLHCYIENFNTASVYDTHNLTADLKGQKGCLTYPSDSTKNRIVTISNVEFYSGYIEFKFI